MTPKPKSGPEKVALIQWPGHVRTQTTLLKPSMTTMMMTSNGHIPKQPCILIITEKDDLHASEVISYLTSVGKSGIVVRLSVEDFQTNTKATFDGHDYHISVLDSGISFSSKDILTVWFRKPKVPNIEEPDEGVRLFIEKEFASFIKGLYSCTKDHAFWINSREASISACNKMYQLKIASEIGFNVPRTIITNDPEEVKGFLNEGDTVCNKCISSPSFVIGDVPHLYCTHIREKEEILEHLDSISVCPTLFQQFIDKALDIRVTIIGKRLFCCEIHSQDYMETMTDFRILSPEKLIHKKHVLPMDLMEKINRFMEVMGLQFSAMDLVLDKCGKYWFIENNCNGQWLWIEYLTGMPMIEAMSELLLNGSK